MALSAACAPHGFRFEAELVAALRHSLRVVTPDHLEVFQFMETRAGLRIIDVALAMLDRSQVYLTAAQISGIQKASGVDIHVLAHLQERPLSPATLAKRMFMKPTDVEARLTILERRGLVTRNRVGTARLGAWKAGLPVRTSAIEAKLLNWGEALAQAQHYRDYAHEAWIALPAYVCLSPRVQSACVSGGVGLLAVSAGSGAEVKVQARRAGLSHRRRVHAMQLFQKMLRHP